MKRLIIQFLVFIILVTLSSCGKDYKPQKREDGIQIVFKHGKLAGNPSILQDLIFTFEKEHPGIKVRSETLPASTDEQHQFYVINLEGRGRDFDVMSIDVIWVSEFARAGWLKDLSSSFPLDELQDFFPAPIEAVTYKGKLYAAPWYVDAGVLFYRRDLLRKYGFQPPQTWKELGEIAQYITSREKGLYGFIWQGKQYEGLVCNALEYLRSNNGAILKNENWVIDSPENIEAITFMRDLIIKYGVTPPFVTNSIEEPTRHIFGNGKALFMRNWPYAWTIFEKEGSPVKGKVGICPVPHFLGGKSTPTLGGWQLAVSRFSKHPEAAGEFIRFLVSQNSQKILALGLGYKPSRMSLYSDKDLLEKEPLMKNIYAIVMAAKPRPVSPYYMMITQVLQSELSAIISGIKDPGKALRDAQTQIDHILEADK